LKEGSYFGFYHNLFIFYYLAIVPSPCIASDLQPNLCGVKIRHFITFQSAAYPRGIKGFTPLKLSCFVPQMDIFLIDIIRYDKLKL